MIQTKQRYVKKILDEIHPDTSPRKTSETGFSENQACAEPWKNSFKRV